MKKILLLTIICAISEIAQSQSLDGQQMINNCDSAIRQKYEYENNDRYGNANEAFFNHLEFYQLLQPGMHQYGSNQALMFGGIMLRGGNQRRTTSSSYRIFCVVDSSWQIIGIEREIR